MCNHGPDFFKAVWEFILLGIWTVGFPTSGSQKDTLVKDSHSWEEGPRVPAVQLAFLEL